MLHGLSGVPNTLFAIGFLFAITNFWRGLFGGFFMLKIKPPENVENLLHFKPDKAAKTVSSAPEFQLLPVWVFSFRFRAMQTLLEEWFLHQVILPFLQQSPQWVG
jgi:hypothetical protein